MEVVYIQNSSNPLKKLDVRKINHQNVSFLLKISKIILYDEPTVPEIQIVEIKKFIINTFPVTVEIRDNFFKNLDERKFEEIASTRIFDLKNPFQKHTPTVEEIKIEIENTDMSENEEKILYDGFEFHKKVAEFIPINENDLYTLHIIFTNKITCTFDDGDFRYHARALIGSNPMIISTTGMIEAPAKPKKYYLELMTEFTDEKIEELKKKYKGEFLEYHDSRLSEIAKGYILQAIMYYETGDAFCDNSDCRLYNAHWQKDLFHTQIENKKFCNKHQKLFEELKN
ncbi:DUF6775 family putative metallopeptidase [Candidatus Nitrosopumilus salarius]|uniref:DUF6775 family putative metallopeptidase n=1 Tax=Candidatus Nitrosopumilus salarius TaxID=1170320 RepID=UPI0026A6EAE7|nr:DUF6775 family putative metallopeptidase [Candidatus Nitrosopumilus salaria]